MLRIICIENAGAPRTFKLEGKLLAPWVGEVLSVCAPGNSIGDRAHLDLSGLMFVDAAGTAALRKLLHAGLEISACSGFVAALLHRENS